MRPKKSSVLAIGWVLAGLLLVSSLPLPAVSAAEDDERVQPLADFLRVAEAVLVLAKEQDFVQRYKQLFGTVAETHALDRMLSARLGSVEARLSAAQRKALKDLLFKRLVATYAMAFDGVAGQRLERVGVVAQADGTMKATLRLHGQDDARTITMHLGPDGDAPKILSVGWAGSDDVDLERAATEKAWQSGGFEALQKAWNELVPLPDRKPVEETKTPRQVVERLQDALIDVMRQASSLGYQGRYDRLLPVVDATHDLAGIARLTLNRHWKQLSPDQQKRFAERFRVLSIARYAGRFDGYAGEAFEVIGEEKERSTDVVKSDLVKSNGERIPFVFQLRSRSKRGPRILNITADGVSDLATKQAEYARIMETGGFDALMTTVEAQIRKQASGS